MGTKKKKENKRDNFSPKTKDELAKRVNYTCSNPKCGRATSGPHADPQKHTNIGVASHIYAASKNGPRYNSAMTSEGRKDISNGIWLCENCGTLIDKDEKTYPAELLKDWKKEREQYFRDSLEEIDPQDNPKFRRPVDMDKISVLKFLIRVDKDEYDRVVGYTADLYSYVDVIENVGSAVEEKLLEMHRDGLVEIGRNKSNIRARNEGVVYAAEYL